MDRGASCRRSVGRFVVVYVGVGTEMAAERRAWEGGQYSRKDRSRTGTESIEWAIKKRLDLHVDSSCESTTPSSSVTLDRTIVLYGGLQTTTWTHVLC